MWSRRTAILSAAVAFTLLPAAASRAVAGVIEISQAKNGGAWSAVVR